MAEHTPGPWKIVVEPVSHSLKETGYAHQVMIPGNYLPVTVAHHQHTNWDHIYTERFCGDYVRQTGEGSRPPDLTPHPDAVLIAAAPDLLAILEVMLREAEALDNEHGSFGWDEAIEQARGAIAKARGEP